MNEINKLCKGYKKLNKLDDLYNLLEPYYNMEKSKPLLCATPWKMVHENKKCDIAILALHGFQGYPGEMIYPGLALYNSNFDVYCPRYPGHGVTKEAFLNTDANDWINVARTSLGYLKKEYREVYVIGHSMGGLITSIVANEFDVKKIALISPAFYIKGFSHFKLLTIKIFKNGEITQPWQTDKSFWGICERDEGDDEYLGENYWSKINAQQINQLNIIRKKALNAISKSSSETICILGDKDLAIDVEKVNELMKHKGNKTILLKGVNHLCQYFNVKEKRDKCNNSIVNFFLD
ncbi:MAG: alpha/beta hydrolase [Pleomorphochaeta sp.]